jgi:hypothetical protein
MRGCAKAGNGRTEPFSQIRAGSLFAKPIPPTTRLIRNEVEVDWSGGIGHQGGYTHTVVNEQFKALLQFTRSDVFLIIDNQHVASL